MSWGGTLADEQEVYRGFLPGESTAGDVPFLGPVISALAPVERDVITPPETTYIEDMGVRYPVTTEGEYGDPRFGPPAALQGIFDFVQYLRDDPKAAATAAAEGIMSIPEQQYYGGLARLQGFDAAFDPETGEEFRYDDLLFTGPTAVGTAVSAARETSGMLLGSGPADLARRLRVGKGGIRGLAHGIKKNDLFEIDPLAAKRYFSKTDDINPEEMLLYRGGFDLGGRKLTVKDVILNSGFSNRARQVLLGQDPAGSTEVKRPGFSTSRDPFLSYSAFTAGGGKTLTPVYGSDLDDILVVSPRRTVREGEDGSFTVDDLVLGDIEDLSPAAYYLKAYDPNKQIQLKPNSEFYEDEIHLGGASGVGADVRPMTKREKKDVAQFINSQGQSYDILIAAEENRMVRAGRTEAYGEKVAPFVAGFSDHMTLLGMLNNKLQSPVLRRDAERELTVAGMEAKDILANEPIREAFEAKYGSEGVSFLERLSKIDDRSSDLNPSVFNKDKETAVLADLKFAYNKLGDDAIESTIVTPMGDTLKGASLSLGGDRGTLRMEPSNNLQVLMQSALSTQERLRSVRAGDTYEVGGTKITEQALVQSLDNLEGRLESEFPAWKLFYQMRPDPDLGRNAFVTSGSSYGFASDVENMSNTLIRAGKTELAADSYPQMGAYRRQVAEEIAALWPNARQALEVNVNKMPEAQVFNAMIREKRTLVDGVLADAAVLFPPNASARVAASKNLSAALENLEKSKKGVIGRGGRDPQEFIDEARQDVKDATVGPRPGAVLYEEGGIVSLLDVARNAGRGPRGVASLAPVARNMNRPMVS